MSPTVSLAVLEKNQAHAATSCYDVDYNIEGGAKYFAQVLSDNSGNALAALGSYNGWFVGMTVADATAAKAAGDCHAQVRLSMDNI